jgi:hypothetical protein
VAAALPGATLVDRLGWSDPAAIKLAMFSKRDDS